MRQIQIIAILLVTVFASCVKEKPVEPNGKTPFADTVLTADTLAGIWEVTEVAFNYYEQDTLKIKWHAIKGDGTYGNDMLHLMWNNKVHATWIDLTKNGQFVHYKSDFEPTGYMLDQILPAEGQWKFIDPTHIELSTDVFEDTSFVVKPVTWTAIYSYPQLIIISDITYTKDGVKCLDNIQMKLEKQYN
jgi:hypothetical protein